MSKWKQGNPILSDVHHLQDWHNHPPSNSGSMSGKYLSPSHTYSSYVIKHLLKSYLIAPAFLGCTIIILISLFVLKNSILYLYFAGASIVNRVTNYNSKDGALVPTWSSNSLGEVAVINYYLHIIHLENLEFNISQIQHDSVCAHTHTCNFLSATHLRDCIMNGISVLQIKKNKK